eukprot:756476-Amphidinium_carterae.1
MECVAGHVKQNTDTWYHFLTDASDDSVDQDQHYVSHVTKTDAQIELRNPPPGTDPQTPKFQ